jgi:Flp pilus assembly protein TadD
MIYYKYRRDSEFTEKLFASGQVRFSTAAQLNDPFECSLQEIASDWISTRIDQMKQAQYAGFINGASRAIANGESFFGLDKGEVQQLLARLRAIQQFDNAYKEYRTFIAETTGNPPSDPDAVFAHLDDQLNAVGIFSLSELADHPLLWAHYTEDHKGLCIGFEAAETHSAYVGRLLKVTYSDTVPKMEDGFQQRLTIALDDRGRLRATSEIAFSDPVVQAAIRTKSTHWSYEQEWRCVAEVAGDYPWPGRLVEVVFGLRCPQERRDFYRSLAKDFVANDVEFFEIRKIRNSNALERIRLPSITRRSSAADSLSDKEVFDQVSALAASGQLDPALTILDGAGLPRRNNANLWNLKGEVLGRSGRPAEALRFFERCIALYPNVPTAWYQSGVALSALKRHEQAIISYRKAHELNPQDASTALNLGAELRLIGKLDEGKAYLADAARLGHPRAADFLRVIDGE